MALCMCGPGLGLSLLMVAVALWLLTCVVWSVVVVASWIIRSFWPERHVDVDRPSF